MVPMVRSQQPDCLASNGQTWIADWANKLAADPTATWSWKSKPCETAIRTALAQGSGGHCSYCDSWPKNDPEIDHWKPKRRFPMLSFEWTNLYGACHDCNNKKGDRFDEALLRPDEEGYDFDRYFTFVGADFALAPNPAAPAEDQRRAEITIQMLGLNRVDLRDARRKYQGTMFRYMPQLVLQDNIT